MARIGAASLRSKSRLVPVAAAFVVAVITLVGPACFAAKANTLVQPKRPASSYMLWLSANRAKITKSLGKDAGMTDVAKEAGKKWNAVAESTKKKYATEANKLKKKYEKDLAAFVEAGGEIKARKSKAKTEKKVKDPNAPKRPPSSYLLWLADSRPKIAKSLPKGSAVTEVTKAAGAQWKKLTAKTKGPYVKKAEKASADYKKAMAEYMASTS
jgi:hypothetical protein